jgi:hypothetical protein
MFLWNFDAQMKIANIIKQKHPNIKLIAGGPNIDHKNPNTANNYPFIDYFVYGDGEKAFTMLLDSFYEPIDEKTIPNLITKEFKTNHEILRFKDYPAFNVFYDLKEDFINEYNLIADDLEKNNYLLYIHWEKTRGCPYACSFCDWGAGLHHKVNKRLGDWKKELKFLSNFDKINIRWIDANIGMLKEDVEIFKYGLAITDDNFITHNMAKLHKARVFEIWEAIYLHNPTKRRFFKVSLQHQDEQVLKNINRPEIPWEEHKKLLTDFRQKYKEARYKVELIHGLPGSTIKAHKKQLIEFSRIPINHINLYPWELLCNSQAYNKSYQKKHNLKIFNAVVITMKYNIIDSTLDNLYHNVSIDNYNPTELYKLSRVYDNNLSIKEYLTIIYMTIIYNMMFSKEMIISNHHSIKFNEFLNYTMPIIQKFIIEQTRDWEEKYKKYGFVIFGMPFGPNDTQTIQLNIGMTALCKKLFTDIMITRNYIPNK